MTHTIWTASPSELATVMDLLNARVAWLRERGSDQWSTYERWEPEMAESIDEHRTWLLRDRRNEPVGTITLSTEGDPDFWTVDERHVPALYPAKLATRLDVRGQHLGRLLLDFARYMAVAQRLQEVRLDVWKTSAELHRYYEREGWKYLRTVEKPGRFSGALFTRHVVPPPLVNMPPCEIRPPGGGASEHFTVDPFGPSHGTV